MQPAFFCTNKTVAVPFGSRVIAQLPREHRLVKNGSFGDAFVEGTYIYCDSATPCIWMFSIALQRKIQVQDFQSFPLQFPFKDLSCLSHNTPTIMKEISKMHEEDAHDDDLIAMETSNQIHTRAQMHAAVNAANSHILEPTDVHSDTSSPLLLRNPAVTATNKSDNVTLLPSILPPRATSGDDSAATRPSVQHDEAGIDLHANLVHYSELEIAKALARHSVEIGLTKHYTPNHVVPEGKMRVVGVKAKKISSTKAALIVKIISPPSLKNVQMQIFCTSLEPNTKQGQGANLSIMTALTLNKSGAKLLFDLGVRCKPRSETTCGMIAAFDSMLGGKIIDASQASSDDIETSEQNHFGDECHLQSSRDPVGYSKGAPNLKHHGQAMRNAMKATWIKSPTSEMDGLWCHGVFQKVLCSSLTPQDRVFTSHFHYKIKRKGGVFDKYKVRLVVQGQHMR